MIKKYNVTVNGKSYQVELEEITDGPAVSAPSPAKPADVSAPGGAKAPEKAAAKPAAPGADTINAPMPGTILSVKVEAGASVKRGDVLLILEAMKMENEIMAHVDGVVAAVHTSPGASVNTGDPLVSLR